MSYEYYNECSKKLLQDSSNTYNIPLLHFLTYFFVYMFINLLYKFHHCKNIYGDNKIKIYRTLNVSIIQNYFF